MEHRSTALVVENNEMHRSLVSLLLEESQMMVIECESAEAAVLVLERSEDVSIVFTDVELAGWMDGIELAYLAKEKFPDVHVVVTSGSPRIRRLPDGTVFMAKPWSAIDLLRERNARCTEPRRLAI